MIFIKSFFSNYCLMSAMFAWLLAQIIKSFTGVFRLQTFSLRAFFFGTGGMPSSHSAAVVALTTSVFLKHGVGSTEFAIAGIFMIVVLIDAMGVRLETGKQAKALNLIFAEWAQDKQNENFNQHFKELIGHTPFQVLCGAVVGVGTAFLLLLFPVFREIL